MLLGRGVLRPVVYQSFKQGTKMINCLFKARKLFKLLFGVTGNITLLAKYGVNYGAIPIFIFPSSMTSH